MAVSISESKCPQNHPCPILRVCAVHAISQNGFGLPVVDESKCTDCGKCIRYCPTRAISSK